MHAEFFTHYQIDQAIRICKNFQRIAQKVLKSKKAKISATKPKHKYETTFETLKYLQQTMF
jgi:hypothetical protein